MNDTRLTNEFVTCLENLESSDNIRRRHGVAILERLGGAKAARIARTLLNDQDKIISQTASRICAKHHEPSIAASSPPPVPSNINKHILRYPREVLDETVFIMRRNLTGIYANAALTAIPKLVLSFLIFHYFAQIFPTNQQTFSAVMLSFIFIHQLLWRPLIFMSVGRAVLAGFPERKIRQLAKSANNWEDYTNISGRNILTALPFCGLGLIMNTDPVALLVAVAAFGVLWEVCIAILPMSLLMPNTSISSALHLRFSSFVSSSAIFLFHLFLLYLMVISSSMLSMDALGVDLSAHRSVGGISTALISVVIIADCLIDPFIIAWRIVTTRLALRRGRLL